jgi:hypothetical protein
MVEHFVSGMLRACWAQAFPGAGCIVFVVIGWNVVWLVHGASLSLAGMWLVGLVGAASFDWRVFCSGVARAKPNSEEMPFNIVVLNSDLETDKKSLLHSCLP